MQKDQIEEILISVKQGNKQLIHLRTYRNGKFQRIGTGASPSCDLAVSTTLPGAALFKEILATIPEHLPSTNLFGDDITGNQIIEYVLAFYGGTHYSDHSSGKEWELSSGIRILVDPRATYTHPLLPVVDMIANKAERSSARLYFDAMLCYAFGARSNELPENTILAGPKNYSEKQKLFSDYISTLHANGQFTSLVTYGETQTYTDTHQVEHKLSILQKENKITVQLLPTGIRGMQSAFQTAHKTREARSEIALTSAQVLQNNIISMLTSMKVVFFILMLACIVYLTFYL